MNNKLFLIQFGNEGKEEVGIIVRNSPITVDGRDVINVSLHR